MIVIIEIAVFLAMSSSSELAFTCCVPRLIPSNECDFEQLLQDTSSVQPSFTTELPDLIKPNEKQYAFNLTYSLLTKGLSSDRKFACIF